MVKNALNWFDSSADGKYEASYEPNALILETGDIVYIPPAIFKSIFSLPFESF